MPRFDCKNCQSSSDNNETNALSAVYVGFTEAVLIALLLSHFLSTVRVGYAHRFAIRYADC